MTDRAVTRSIVKAFWDVKNKTMTLTNLSKVLNDTPTTTTLSRVEGSDDQWIFNKDKVRINAKASVRDNEYADSFVEWITTGGAAAAGFNIMVVGGVAMDLGVQAAPAAAVLPPPAVVPPAADVVKEVLAQIQTSRAEDAKQLADVIAKGIREATEKINQTAAAAMAEASRVSKEEFERDRQQRDAKEAAEKAEMERVAKARDAKEAAAKAEMEDTIKTLQNRISEIMKPSEATEKLPETVVPQVTEKLPETTKEPAEKLPEPAQVTEKLPETTKEPAIIPKADTKRKRNRDEDDAPETEVVSRKKLPPVSQFYLATRGVACFFVGETQVESVEDYVLGMNEPNAKDD
jgi:hypothetical protein